MLANKNLKINSDGLAIIKHYEGLKLKAYICPGGVWTIGYGSTLNVKEGDVITKEQAVGRLKADVSHSENIVIKRVEVILNSNQFSALVSLVFNIGSGAFARSTLLKLLNDGDYSGASSEFLKWRLSKGKILAGLVKRRAAERELFLKPISEPTGHDIIA